MNNVLACFPAETVPCLPEGTTLVLNMDLRVVSLVTNQRLILTQCRLPHGSFRLLTLLLQCPQGNSYAELFACLHCPDNLFEDIFHACSTEHVKMSLLPYTLRWQEHLTQLMDCIEPGYNPYERELKILRRLVKEEHGVHDQFVKHRFGVIVHTLYKKGYILLRESEERERQKKKNGVFLSKKF